MLAFYVDKEVRARESWELGENRCTKGSRSLDSLSCCPQCTAGLEGCLSSSKTESSEFHRPAYSCECLVGKERLKA